MHAVMLSVDCVRSLSVVWKVLASKQDLVEKLHYVDTEVEVIIMTKHEGTWILAVAKGVLDVVLSVAASVISSLLLISGDVEENPGPLGGIPILYSKCLGPEPGCIVLFSFTYCMHTDLNYNSVDKSQILSKFLQDALCMH